ncbi:hypothetical protein SAMN06265182_0978 [Persephonella hydrogeniphila]|uniref:Uncharacterized protein n=1 Tax=Persephonella hydrogeniphila TaxID=198703 RepID=A0A285NE28_9AQUI|nr:phage regulatory CII family protein [Persephonella hydrogeniphila]SNZ07709.1 hypothetical protein SAMN06265182_0978 [Persephonella hydrogeniphila]
MCKPAFKDLALELGMEIFQEGKDKGFDDNDLAEFIGSKPSSIKAYRYGDSTPSLAVFVGAWKRIKPIRTLKKLASWSNCVVIQLPEVEEGFGQLIQHTGQVMKETSDVIEKFGKAISDGILENKEIDELEKEIEEAIEALVQLKLKLEKERK